MAKQTMFSLTSLHANPDKQLNGLQASPKLRSLSEQVHQSLLTFATDDKVNILIDVGWDPALSSSLDHILALAPEIDLILLTPATMLARMPTSVKYRPRLRPSQPTRRCPSSTCRAS